MKGAHRQVKSRKLWNKLRTVTKPPWFDQKKKQFIIEQLPLAIRNLFKNAGIKPKELKSSHSTVYLKMLTQSGLGNYIEEPSGEQTGDEESGLPDAKKAWSPEDGPPPITEDMPLAEQLRLRREFMDYQAKTRKVEPLDANWAPKDGPPSNMDKLSRLDQQRVRSMLKEFDNKEKLKL